MTDRDRPFNNKPASDGASKAKEPSSTDPAANDRSAFPRFEEKSVLGDLEKTGPMEADVRLRDLVDETSLPEITMGPEKYKVVKSLGHGGMGAVYRVFDRDVRRRAALKINLRSEIHRKARFIEEAQIMGQLQHPNILPLYELGLSEQRQPYYTMPEVRGQTLKAILGKLRAKDPAIQRTFTLTRLIQVFLQVATAISYAHDKGVIHRDLKPSNIMVGEHGEVQVLDWGVSKVILDGEVKTDLGKSLTREGHVVGTPGYMAPEQAVGDEADTRADIYSLGVLLYEILTLERPFHGSQAELMAAVLREEPLPPRVVAPRREIPLELERICMKAVSRRPESRQQRVSELHEEIQQWLEAESDRTKRHERAEKMARLGAEKLAVFRSQSREVKKLDAEVVKLRKHFKGWQPVNEKGLLLEAVRALKRSRSQLVETASDVVATLAGALSFESENPRARETLADFYWAHFQEAEERQEPEDIRFYGKLVATYHDGKYTRQLLGDGSLALQSDPPAAEAYLYPIIEEDFRLVPVGERPLGPTPVGPVSLPMGSYVVILKKPGYRDVRYPVFISRSREWTGRVRLYADDEIGERYIYVPGGTFIQGGDHTIPEWSLPRFESVVDDFFIARHPVTMGEYVEFLNDVARRSVKMALSLAPRRSAGETTYLAVTPSGRFELPDRQATEDIVHPRWPVYGVSWYQAVVYCRWRSEREGREVRLPTATEWEKAARGVDGRWYPWGNHFDPCLCNMMKSRRDVASPVSVDEFPDDLSVYGVRGMGGNVSDWTATEFMEVDGQKARRVCVVRGGAWLFTSVLTRCARYSTIPPDTVGSIGFRLARPAGRPARRTR